MAEVYELAMKIGVTGNVLAMLSQISSNLRTIAGEVDLVNSKLAAAFESIGKIGLALAGAGFSVLFALNKVSSVWDEILQKQKLSLASGESLAKVTADSAFALEQARKQHVLPITSETAMMGLTSLFGDDRAKRLLPKYLETQEAMRNLGDETDLMPYMRMLKRKGMSDEQIGAHIDFLKRISATLRPVGGSAEDYISAYKMSGGAFEDMTGVSQQAMIPLLQAQPAGGRSNIGQMLGQEFLDTLGDSKKAKTLQGLLPEGVNLKDLQNAPYELSQQLARGMNLKDIPADQRDNYIENALGPTLGKAIVPIKYMMEQGQYMLGAQSPFGQPDKTQSAEEINKITDALQARTRIMTEMSIAFAELGSKGLTDEVLKRWKQLADAATQFADWTKTLDEDTVRTATKVLIGMGAGLAGVGTVMAGAAMVALIGPAGALVLLAGALGGLAAVDPSGLNKIIDFLNRLEAWAQSHSLANWFMGGGAYQQEGQPPAPDHTYADWWKGVKNLYSGGPPAPNAAPPLSFTDRWNTGALAPLPQGADANAWRNYADAIAPGGKPSGQTKTVTAVTNLNISGRMLAQAVQYYMMQENELATGAAAANGAAMATDPSAGQSDN